MFNRKSVLFLVALLVLGLLTFGLMGCAGEGEGEESKGTVDLLYVTWECATASTYVVKAVLEDMGYEVNANSVAAPLMYSSLSTGDADAITTLLAAVTWRVL